MKLKWMNYRTFTALLFLILAFVIGLYAQYSMPKEIHVDQANSIEYWESRLRIEDPQKVTDAFVTYTSAFDQGTQHGLGHVFGSAVYKALGQNGISLCDSNFSYGCFHSFLADEIATNGIGTIADVASLCAASTSPVNCSHGIGHGVLGYLGYQESVLKKALDVCTNVVKDSTGAGCRAGVIMEHNLRTMLSSEDRKKALEMPVEENSRQCIRLTEDDKPMCYFLAPQAWYARLTSHEESTAREYMKKMRHWCKDSGEYMYACVAGVGRGAATISDYNVMRAAEFCDETFFDVPTYKILCRGFAANVLLNDARTTDTARSLCDLYTGKDKEKCIGYAQEGDKMFDL